MMNEIRALDAPEDDSPATQLLDSDQLSQSQDSAPVQDRPWGLLCYVFRKLQHKPCIDLRKPTFTFGKQADMNDVVLEEEDVGTERYAGISRCHFKIELVDFDGDLKLPQITDLSANGTFVQGTELGKNKSRILSSGDVISIVKPVRKIFAFHMLDPPNTDGMPAEINSQYSILSSLGSGGFGHVYRVVKKESIKEMAMKVIEHSTNSHVDPFVEPQLMYKLNHTNIITIYSTLQVDFKFFLFMEFMKGGDLAGYVGTRKHLSETVAKHIIYQTVCGVQELHARKIIHRDIKPLNILLSNTSDYPVVKISDFGLAKQLKQNLTELKTFCGTRSFSAPELIAPRTVRSYDNRCDIWSIGIMTYYCLSGDLPFVTKASDAESVETRIKTGRFHFEPLDRWTKMNYAVMDLIKRILQPNYNYRPFASEVLNHPWFRKDMKLIRKFMQVQKESQVGDENCSPTKKIKIV